MSDSGKILYFDPIPTHSASEDSTEMLSPLDVLDELTRAMEDCGQDPATQLAGYLITEDPTYLPEGTNARALARRVGRDKLLATLIELYLSACTDLE